MSARRAAYELLRRVFEEGAYADRAFRSIARELSARDRAFAMELGYGAVRQQRLLDHAIAEIGGRAVSELDQPVRTSLRLGAYQLAFSASVPAHAAVNETVELVRDAGLGRASGFVNAVMRRLSEQIARLIDGLDDSSARGAALRHSYPDWIAETWWQELGPEAARRLMLAQNRPAEVAVRLNHRDIAAPDGVEQPFGETDPDLPAALVVERVLDGWLEHGLAWPQSRASQLVAACVGSSPGERVLDLCAAPGGKATQLLGDVVAVEVNPSRARQLADTVRAQRATNVEVVLADARRLDPSLRGFDRVLLDAPCSGLGVLQARPDLRWRARPLPELQAELLRHALERVRIGGTVTYSVCTLTRAETEEIVEGCGAPLEDLGSAYPRFRHPRRPQCLLTLPHEHGTAGFFVASLRRTR